MKRDTKNMEEILKQHLPRPSQEIMESKRDLVWQNIRSQVNLGGVRSSERKIALRWKLMTAAVAVFVGVMAAVLLVNTRTPLATVEVADGSLYRVSRDKEQALHHGDSIYRGETIRANGGGGSVIELADGSRVEMRSQTDLSLERDDDDIRLRLSKGGVIVNAARQRSGHLFVITKDVSVSVVGTVFLVNAEEEGSRVAVIEGEVRVETKKTAEKLLPGQQVATNPAMESRPVREEISWSRNIEEHLALLQVSAASAEAQEKAASEKFETISIRPTPREPVIGGRRGGGEFPRGNPCFPQLAAAADGVSLLQSVLQLDRARLRVRSTTLHALISAAYGVSCNLREAISGEPDWASSESYEVEATMPPGFPAYTRNDVLTGNAPKLQLMLQNLLADRFKLSIRQDTKEMSAYNLIVARPPKWECVTPSSCHGLRLSENQSPDAEIGPRQGPRQFFSVPATYTPHTTLTAWAEQATFFAERPVIDMTGLKGYYDIRMEFLDGTPERPEPGKDFFVGAIQNQLGLKLEPTRAAVKVLIVDHVEKPSEN
jgi:uncharacterized protein (TIGR03435 family)